MEAKPLIQFECNFGGWLRRGSDVITCANFGKNRIRGLGVAGGQSLPFSVDFDCRPYNTVALPSESDPTRNTFCEMWYLPHYDWHCHFSIHVCETASFLLLVWYLTPPSCSSTSISCVTWEFQLFVNIIDRNWYNYVCMDFQDLLAQNGGFFVGGGQNRGSGVCWPQRTHSYFSGLLSRCHFWRKLIKKCDHVSVDRQTVRHAVTETNWIYNLSHAMVWGELAEDKGPSFGYQGECATDHHSSRPVGRSSWPVSVVIHSLTQSTLPTSYAIVLSLVQQCRV